MDTEATQRAKKGGKERKRKTAPKEGRGTGEEEEEVEVEGEPEKDTLSQFDGTVLPGNSPSQQRIGNFTGVEHHSLERLSAMKVYEQERGISRKTGQCCTKGINIHVPPLSYTAGNFKLPAQASLPLVTRTRDSPTNH
ncbi:uncharacterized protein N7458_006640 [Penicillium daleae]|uniref:Uncharacterized protein n=1 Tax=Penicillium daleae TaxID=63821 RepID=A0AAD6G363_9EURO|nr:uncharacterized protein N7458_006640 [Penicillium daleae]KAJ5450191.1 hypothetical protein N7458_006640 [Penicillium daleae]